MLSLFKKLFAFKTDHMSSTPKAGSDRSSEILEVFATAERYYRPVMNAASSGRLTSDVERNLYEALKWLDKLCDLDTTHGEPRGMRGNLYMILAQIERQRSYLDKADSDFSEAIRLGSRDRNNLSTWGENRSSVAQLRSLI